MYKLCTTMGVYKVEVYKPDKHVVAMKFMQSDGFIDIVTIELPDNIMVDLYDQIHSTLFWRLNCLFTTPMVSTNGERYEIWMGDSKVDAPSDDDPDHMWFIITATRFGAGGKTKENIVLESWMDNQDVFNFLLALEPIVEDIRHAYYG